jgi:hypothetical protein
MSKLAEDKFRRDVLANDLSVLQQQGSTMLDHARSAADDDRGGRFAAVNTTTVIGADPIPKYPTLPASSPWAGPDPVPKEEPLGYSVNDLEPSTGLLPLPVETGPAVAAAPSLFVEGGDGQRSDAGPSSSTEGSNNAT